MKKIVVIGEILVEIMADSPGAGFLEPIALTGPFPSGAPAIFADQAARLGQPCAIVSAVGDDDFGRLNIDRLHRDGVDVCGHPHRRRPPDRQRLSSATAPTAAATSSSTSATAPADVSR